jgi:hypothetical protein
MIDSVVPAVKIKGKTSGRNHHAEQIWISHSHVVWLGMVDLVHMELGHQRNQTLVK